MLSSTPVQCPPDLLSKARTAGRVRTLVVGANSLLALESARLADDEGLIEPVLIGGVSAIHQLADQIEWDLSRVDLIDAEGDGLVAEAAARAASSKSVEAVMKGHIHTDTFMAALLRPEAAIRTDRRLTHLFHMTVPQFTKALMITDAALNILPNYRTKKAAILNAVEMARALGINVPNLAILSATETPSERMPSSIEAERLMHWAGEAVPGAYVHGPMAFDSAVSEEASRIKGITSPVSGTADILLVPNIETGNALFKMMVYFMGACAAGLVLGGRIPVMLTSRADPPAARLASAALAAISSAASSSFHRR